MLSYIAFPQVAMAFFKDREAGFPPKEEAKKAEPKKEAAPAPKLEDMAPIPAWQGHVYYTEVPAPAVPGYTSRPIPQFAASYQPAYLKMGKREDLTGSFTVTIDGKPFQVSVAKADGPAAPVAAAPVAAPSRPPHRLPPLRPRPLPRLLLPPRRLPPLPPLPLLRLRLPPLVRLR